MGKYLPYVTRYKKRGQIQIPGVVHSLLRSLALNIGEFILGKNSKAMYYLIVKTIVNVNQFFL